MAVGINKGKMETSEQEELIMDEQNNTFSLETEVLELKQGFFQLEREINQSKNFSKFWLLLKLLVVIVIGFNTQSGNLQLEKEQIIPILESVLQMTSDSEGEAE
ncbi:MAG: hypothetical protein AB4372_12440 [Xenococcus sp. (in: cyanobacteria)]